MDESIVDCEVVDSAAEHLGAVLAPLAARYAGPDPGFPPEEDPAAVRAMAMVLRVERADPPPRTALLEAAAAAAVAVCLDERAAPGGPWHDELLAWTGARIRKIARRARGAHWTAVQELPGVTVSVGDAQARAFVPAPVADTPKPIARLQISGTELDADDPGPPPDGVPLLLCNPEAGMTLGKSAAQVGHASMLLAAALYGTGGPAALADWAATGFRCAVRTPDVPTWRAALPHAPTASAWARDGVLAVHDAGYTEVDPGTITVLATHPR